MKNRLLLTLFLVGILLATISCENDDPIPENKPNPFEMEEGWNGFVMDEGEYETPNAIIEIWGENLDSLSSDYDISFTDGTFNSLVRDVTEYSILVYFDVNSPSLSELSGGIYNFESTTERKPNNIVEAYILFSNETSVIKYPVIEGEVEVSTQDGYILIEYVLKTVKDKEFVDVAGQYTGSFQVIDQQLKN